MILISWNVNSLRARLPRVLELLDAHSPDVVALQETKTTAEQLPREALEAAGYTAVDHSLGRWAGVALLVRSGLEASDPVVGLPGEPVPEEARWVEATVEGVRIASTYVPNGRALDDPAYVDKLAFLDAVAARAALLPRPAVIAGDLNVARTDADVYDPAVFVGTTHTTAAERERVDRLESAGFVDAYRHLHPDATSEAHTWWDYRAGHYHKRLGMRIDLVLVAGASPRRAEVDRTYRKGPKPSDHAPLLVELAVDADGQLDAAARGAAAAQPT